MTLCGFWFYKHRVPPGLVNFVCERYKRTLRKTKSSLATDLLAAAGHTWRFALGLLGPLGPIRWSRSANRESERRGPSLGSTLMKINQADFSGVRRFPAIQKPDRSTPSPHRLPLHQVMKYGSSCLIS